MDVGALMAKAGREETSDAPPDEESAPAPALAAPSAARKTVAKKPAARRARALGLAVLAIALVLVALGVLLLLPVIVKERAIATARDAGFAITIERVGVGLGGATLRGIDVKVPRTPGITATVQEVWLGGFTAKDVRVLGLDAKLTGETSDLEAGVLALAADNRARFAGTPSSPRHLSVVGARLSWTGSEGEHLHASDIGLELDSHGAGVEELRGSAGRFEVKSKRTTFGPWSLAFERASATSRVRLMFDPPVPDGPSALLVWKTGSPTELTVKIPRTTFANLGVRPAELGVPADDATDVQISVAGTISPATRSEVTFDANLWALRPTGFTGAVDVRLEGAARGAPGKPLELDKTTVSLGPFVAGVTGTIAPYEYGARLDAMFKTLPLPCAELARAEAKNMGPLAATLQAFGQSTGALRVTGAVNASGVVKYDTAEPEGASVTWLAKETCGVSIFGM